MTRFGYCRSRALWDEARLPEASFQSRIRAVLYELQPVRVAEAAEWYNNVSFTIVRRVLPTFYELSQAIWQIIPLLYTKQFIKVFILGLSYYGMIRLVHA
jgi:hypothetical protein